MQTNRESFEQQNGGIFQANWIFEKAGTTNRSASPIAIRVNKIDLLSIAVACRRRFQKNNFINTKPKPME